MGSVAARQPTGPKRAIDRQSKSALVGRHGAVAA
jgi:hypothetical protein